MKELDPRSVANLILDEADRRGRCVTNLSLQKIVYFVHGRFLVEEKVPLIAGSFEAWQYGPVSLPVYESFKCFASQPITGRATQKDIRSKEQSPIPLPSDAFLRRKIVDLAVPYLSLSAGRLVDLSHAKRSPWDIVTREPDGTRSFGLRISNDNIRENFRYHLIALRAEPCAGEPDEESPPY